jgi:hypothetical protein
MEGEGVPGASEVLTSKLKKWLSTQGYPLEMRISRIARNAGLRVNQGHHYYDREQNVHREVDVLATSLGSRIRDCRVEVVVVFETKSSAGNSKPWVILADRGNSMHPVARTRQRLTTGQSEKWWERAARNSTIQELDIFSVDDVRGYSLIRPSLSTKESREDQAYAALMQLAKAANGICEWFTEAGTIVSPHTKRKHETIAVILPVLVVDSPLYECWLDEDGELQVQETEKGTVMWKNRVSRHNSPTTIIKVMREGAVADYLENVKAAMTALSGDFEVWYQEMRSQRGWSEIE